MCGLNLTHRHVSLLCQVFKWTTLYYTNIKQVGKKYLHSFPVIASSNFHCLLQSVFFLLLSSSCLQNKNIILFPIVFAFLGLWVSQGYYEGEVEAEMLILWCFIHFKSVHFSSLARLMTGKQT